MGTITTPIQATLWAIIVLPLIMLPLLSLKKKGCTTEINVIWYAFSLVFVIWWSLNAALALSLIELPPLPSFDVRRVDEPWTPQRFYLWAAEFLTGLKDELGLVAAVLIIVIVPQVLTYILSGLSGCASTPKLVWQFEKIAIWSLIKFLAAFGGFLTASAADLYDIKFDPKAVSTTVIPFSARVERLLEGLTAVAIAFVITILQVYFLEFANSLRQAWKQKPKSWPYRVHRFFTRNLPRGLLDWLIELVKADYPDDWVRFCHLARIIERDASDDDDEAARRRLRVYQRYDIAGFSSGLGREVSESNELRKKFVEHFADVLRDHMWIGRALRRFRQFGRPDDSRPVTPESRRAWPGMGRFSCGPQNRPPALQKEDYRYCACRCRRSLFHDPLGRRGIIAWRCRVSSGAPYEICTSHILASGCGRCRAASGLTLRAGANLPVAAGTHHCRLCPGRLDRHQRPSDRSMAIGASGSAIHHREPAGRGR
jgi:hypothetical protein